MTTDLIRYDLLVQDALRSVVRNVLVEAARDGLPGDHHFFISFRTQAPGVRLSARMREQYPKEMTIVLQHQFWDLVVGDAGFEVGLSFHGKAETLAIPFSAVTGFFDPSVDFGLKFEIDTEAAGAPEGPGAHKSVELIDATAAPRLPALDKANLDKANLDKANLDKTKPRGSASEPSEVNPKQPAGQAGGGTKTDEMQPANEANVVSIDAFRKKP